MEDERKRREMGVEARAFAENFTWEASARKMEAFLRDRVAGSHPPT